MNRVTVFVISVLCFPALLHAQFSGSIGLFGVGLGKTTMDPFTWTNAPTGPNGQEETTLGSSASSGSFFPFTGAEGYSKHVIYQTTFGFGVKHKVKEFPQQIIAKHDGDDMSLRLAFGFYIKKTIGLMVGFHYQYLPIMYDMANASMSDPKAYNNTGGPEGRFFAPGAGGNLTGVNVNGLISLGDQILIRYTYLYSKTSVKYPGSDRFRGKAGQSEVAVYYIFDSGKSDGVFLKFTSLDRNMDPVTNADVQFSYSGNRVNIPELNAKTIWLEFGFAVRFSD